MPPRPPALVVVDPPEPPVPTVVVVGPLPPEPPELPPVPDVVEVVVLVGPVVVLLVELVVVLEVDAPPPPPDPDVLPPPAPLVTGVPAAPVVVPAVTFDAPPNASASSSSPLAHAPEFAITSPTRLNPKKRRIFYNSMSFSRSAFKEKIFTVFGRR
jgi:hypothetical protein